MGSSGSVGGGGLFADAEKKGGCARISRMLTDEAFGLGAGLAPQASLCGQDGKGDATVGISRFESHCLLQERLGLGATSQPLLGKSRVVLHPGPS